MSKPLVKFIQKRKSYSVNTLNKADTIHCPDCDGVLIKAEQWLGCLCYGDLAGRGITLKKNDSGVKVQFSDAWDADSISMLLDILRNKNNSL